MKWRKPRPDLPEAAQGEHFIASTTTVDGRELIATDHAFYLDSETRIRWSEIAKAEWQEPYLTIALLGSGGSPGERLRFDCQESSQNLAAAVHDRVTASVVVTERVDLDGTGTALITARRNRDDETISWTVLFEAGVDPNDPRIRGQAEQALQRLRASLGI